MNEPVYQPGDRVRHTGKPQWGIGRVLGSERVHHEGRDCQRVAIDFPNHGRVTLHTGYAKLEPVGIADPATKEKALIMTSLGATGEDKGKADFLTSLKSLPDAATDLLCQPSARLNASLELYRYSKEPRSLMDWAVAQTGVDDPLSHLSRHELEQEFETFALYRDRHLRKVAESLRKEGLQHLLHDQLHKLSPTERDTVAKALRGR